MRKKRCECEKKKVCVWEKKVCIYNMENKLIDIISGGILLYILINVKEIINKKTIIIVKKELKSSSLVSKIGLLLLLIVLFTNIYYKIHINKLTENTKKKLKKLWNATLAGLVALIIGYFAYIDKILPVFFFVFVLHYYLSIDDS